jgi:hypothetical protein
VWQVADLLNGGEEGGILAPTPVTAWRALAPQLLSRLSLSDPIAGRHVLELARRLAEAHPRDLAYAVTVGSSSDVSLIYDVTMLGSVFVFTLASQPA